MNGRSESAPGHGAGVRGLELAARSPEGTCTPRFTLYLRFGKRLLDTFCAMVGFVIASPLLLVCAVAIRLDSPGPIFFRQRRVGKHGKLFQIIKFRTMVDQADRNGLKLTASGDSRLTRVGKWLRKMKVDEIPQLLNVLRGEMSLVGPRPEVQEYVATYSSALRKILELKPGCTGLATLAFFDEERVLASRSDTEDFYLRAILPCKLDLDLSYGATVSFLGDVKLIFATVGKLFRSQLTGLLST